MGCVIDRTAGDAKDTWASGELVEGESKRISFSQEVFKGNGNELMGKKPTKIDEQKLTWAAAKDEIKDAIRDCIDADTTETDMQKCTSNAEAIANMIRGLDENKPMILPAEKEQIKEEKESQRKEALGEDAIDEVDACMATKVGVAKKDADFDSDCKDIYKNRIKRTCGTKVPSGKKDMEMALLKKAAEDMENKASAIKPEKDTDGGFKCVPASENSDCSSVSAPANQAACGKKSVGKCSCTSVVTGPQFKEMGYTNCVGANDDGGKACVWTTTNLCTYGETDLPIDKDIELKARNTIKNKLEDRGFKFRELDMKLRQASEMYAIKNAAALIRSKKEDPLKVGEEKETTDKEITDKVKEIFDQDLDAPDLTEEKKATVIKCARGLAKGGKNGELKEKDEKGVELGISITTEVETEETKITSDDIIQLVKDSPVTSKIVNTDKTDKMDGPKVTKEGVRNPVTGRTTASVRFRPMPGQTAEKVLLEINKLEKEIKTRLRRLGATKAETSSSSSSTFVTGNDDSTASDPKAEESPFQQTDPDDEPPA